jgi:hypothetical protein
MFAWHNAAVRTLPANEIVGVALLAVMRPLSG